MATTRLGLIGLPATSYAATAFDGKTVATAFQSAILIHQFDVYRAGYAGAIVEILKEGTTTRADVYLDVNLSEPADNPQVLVTRDLGGVLYGRFAASLYTPDAYYLRINGLEETGVFYPGIRTLQDQDASEANVTSNNGGIDRTAAERAADTIHVLDFGNFLQEGGSPAENTATLLAAIGVAAAANGGDVILPAGTYEITTIELPADVVLVGQGRNATVLQSEEADSVVTITGDHAGLRHLTLDGINLNPSSIGILAKGKAQLLLGEVTVKRFDVGLKMYGGNDHHYLNLFVENCATCVNLRGDTNTSGGDDGDEFTDLSWIGGAVKESTTYGLYLQQVDDHVHSCTIQDVTFEDNVGTSAVYLQGAHHILFEDCIFTGNTVRHLLTANSTDEDVYDIEFRSCEFTGDEIKLGGSCRDIVFDRTTLATDLIVNFNAPTNSILFRDCDEAATVTRSGSTEKLQRWQTSENGIFAVQTSSSVSTSTVFKRSLNPGEFVHISGVAVGRQRNSAAFATIDFVAAVRNPAASLPFDGQTVNFTLGNTITGGNSGATAVLQSQTDAGANGTLGLIDVVGTFEDNDPLTESGGSGNANVNGTITINASEMVGVVWRPTYGYGSGASQFDIDVTTLNQEMILNVLGPTTGTVDWRVRVQQTDLP